MVVQAHRTTLKKSHKAFKSKHATKSALKARTKGKVEKDSKDSKKKPHALNKTERRNLAKQIRDTKVVDSLIERKFFEGRSGVPKVVSVISLTEDSDPQGFVDSLNKSLEIDAHVPESGSLTVNIDRFRQKLRYILPRRGNFLEILEAAKASDFVIFLMSAEEEVDAFGELCIRTIVAQGVSTAVPVVFNLNESGSVKQQRALKGSLLSFFSHFFPDTDKIYSLESSSDSLNIVRLLCDKLPKGIHWRDSRSYLVADEVYSTDDGMLAIEGTLRGHSLDVNRLIHVPGFGDYQIERVESANAPYIRNNNTNNSNGGDVDLTANETIATPDSTQDDLDELAPYDEGMEDEYNDDGDEGLPEDDQREMGIRLDGHHYFKDPGLHTAAYGIDEELASRRSTKGKVPKGTSDYQASWLIDDPEDYEDEEEQQQRQEEEGQEETLEDEEMAVDDDDNQSTASGPRVRFNQEDEDEAFVDMSHEEEMRQLMDFRERARDDMDFPDEIEMHPEVSAKERLKSYRGIKSLRTCEWDPNERDARRPQEWNRLLDIHNFKATKNRVFKEMAANKVAEVPAGKYIRLVLRAPLFIADSFSKQATFAIYSLLKYEHKLSVVNASILPDSEYDKPVASKENLIMFCGPRRLAIQPLFSQTGNSSNNVHKYERFLQPGRASTATIIAPVTMDNVPVVYFKQESSTTDTKLTLLGTGTIIDTNRSRILAKRAVLTGHPVKIHKKLVTVRYMFFNPEDVQWFKAVPLFTQSGRSGFIKESLGTHGYFKATFDGKISSQDTVGMALYKRVWPKVSQLWT